MNWTRAIVAGVAAGIAMNIYEFVMHGLVMSSTYAKYPELYAQEQANPLYFLLVAVSIAIFAAILFARTRASWASGIKGGRRSGSTWG